jgi:hypothetical protein
MGPYRFRECWLVETHRVHLLAAEPAWPRLIVLEPLISGFEDVTTRWNAMHPLAAPHPNARCVEEIYSCSSCAAVRELLEAQNIRSWPRWWAHAAISPTSSRSSRGVPPHSLLISEYVQRCPGYDGFCTRDNVTALTAAAGHQERFVHGHVFD